MDVIEVTDQAICDIQNRKLKKLVGSRMGTRFGLQTT